MGRFSELATDDSGDTQVDISPLMDCVFILLIFFIVTTTFVEETGVEVDKPQPAAAQNESDEESFTIGFTLSAKDEVLHEGKEVKLAGVRPLVKQLLRELGKETPVIVTVNEGSHTSTLARVLDEAKLAGAETVNLSKGR